MTIKLLLETAQAPTKVGKRWKVIVARPGQGSSGKYSADVLKEFGPAALAPGAQSFITHDSNRNPKDLIGVFPEGGYWDEDENALVSELEVFPHWEEFVETVGPHCGMSIYTQGELDDDGNVTRLYSDPTNGCDLVSRPGLAGSGFAEKLYENARFSAEKEKRREDKMTIEELATKFESLTDLVSELVAAQTGKAQEGAQAEADAAAIETALDAYDSANEAIEAADLLPSQVESLRKAAREGADIVEAIEQAKKVRAELSKELEESAKDKASTGRVFSAEESKSALEFGKVLG